MFGCKILFKKLHKSSKSLVYTEQSSEGRRRLWVLMKVLDRGMKRSESLVLLRVGTGNNILCKTGLRSFLLSL